MIPVGLELEYKNVKIIYSGFQKDDKLCFYVKEDNKRIMYLSLLQFNKAYEEYENGTLDDFDSDNLETYFL